MSVTSKRLDDINRRTRVIRALDEGVCKEYIAADEHVTVRCVQRIAREEGIRACDHRFDICLVRAGVTVQTVGMRDTERIDWVEQNMLCVMPSLELNESREYEIWWSVSGNAQVTHPKMSWRAAVDDARKTIAEQAAVTPAVSMTITGINDAPCPDGS